MVAVGALVALVGCGAATDDTSSSSSDSSDTATTSDASFPSQLAVASPFSVTDGDASSLVRALASSAPSFTRTYVAATARIDQILNGDTPSLCDFDPELFLALENDASCYGPHVEYENHPDSSGGSEDGELPTGDVGMWEETDAETGEACAAAELNARMDGISSRSLASLMGLASMVCVINTGGGSLPVSDNLTLTDNMTALGIADVTFTNAEIRHELDDDGRDRYSYSLEFNYSPSGDSHDIVVDMVHVAGDSTAVYEGQIAYLVGDTMDGGNCPDPEVTHNGSLQYDRASLTDLTAEVRSGTFCGNGSDGRDEEGLIDPSDKYVPVDNDDGWGNNFSIFTAHYDPTTLDGDYAYSWQAGPGDDNSRVFNVAIDTVELAAADAQAGQAFFGYGDDIAETDGSIGGFICNWAGPEADHTLLEFAQYQLVTVDSSGVPTASESNIEYAPVNGNETDGCDYDGSGSFVFDEDGDGDLGDESSAALSDDLYPAEDTDADGEATIEEAIDATGFTLPSI